MTAKKAVYDLITRDDKIVAVVSPTQLRQIQGLVQETKHSWRDDEEVNVFSLRALQERLQSYAAARSVCFVHVTISGRLSPAELNAIIRRAKGTTVRLVFLFSAEMFSSPEISVRCFCWT